MGGAAGLRVAGWRLGRRLGQGAQSAVFVAVREADGTTAALKTVPLPASARAAFLQQAERARRLRHPDIVEVIDAGVDIGIEGAIEGGMGWVAMELVPGGDLGRYTRRPRLLPEPVVLEVGARVARALAHAHRHGLVHRDLKPANVLVHWPTRCVKLADLGLARAPGAEPTDSGVVPGSPAYMAPEQLAGAAPDAPADLYALGVVLFELLAGRRPYEGSSLGELLRRVATEPPPSLAALRPDLPPALGALVGRLLARDPAERGSDGDAVAAVLERIGAAAPPAGAHRRRRPAGRIA